MLFMHRSTYLLARACFAGVFACACATLTVNAGSFNETDGVAIGGYDPVAYLSEQKAVKGSSAFTSVFNGSVFQFKSVANRDAFIASPEKFAPQYGGYCAFGVSRGYKAATSPEAFTVVDGKLYLNYDTEVRSMWAKDLPGYISKADKNWPAVQQTTKVNR